MLLEEVGREKFFHVANGTVIRSVWELEHSLETMGEDTFRYHVNSNKNDFSSWVADVLLDGELANCIGSLKDRHEMRIAVLRRLVKVLKDGIRI